jgi:UDP-GlcNAc3NAcA epimerase
MQDAALYYASKAEEKSDILQKIGGEKFVLATIHRQENTDHPEKLRNIVEGLNQIHRQVRVIVPLHPRTRKILQQLSIIPNFTIIEPVGYFDMIVLEKSCELIITDSGGVQKEAFFFGKHCITLREQTEWIELVENGFNILVGSDVEKLLQAFATFQNKKSDFSIDLYGNGHAAEKAAKDIAAF